ncbi:MAG: peptidoglycan DD-metalloendopeptidase family protein [Cryomorphaceae bacterium]|jgi:septal ring factor EnvC (AmiA/AmiB activator)|nr:peptidoglycan DD-metalloendopeptidase family protein [Cryomorphaceae bacterium]
MKNVINLLLFLSLTWHSFAQQDQKQLKREQQKLEKRISNTKKLLSKVKNNSQASLNEIRLIENQIKSREALVNLFDNQVRTAEMKIVQKKIEIKRLRAKLSSLKDQYRKMFLYAYKHRGNYNKVMYLLASSDYNEALRRNRYLKKVAKVQRKQAALIKQHQQLIYKEINQIDKEKQIKQQALLEKQNERQLIEKDKVKKEKSYQKFKKEEQALVSQLKEDERKKIQLKKQIDAAIRADIAKEQAREAARKAEQVKKQEKTPTTTAPTNSPATAATPAPKRVATPVSTEGAAIGKSFETNRGRLPWPVDNGSVTEKFGRNYHPTLSGIEWNNNGIDITCNKGSRVRAVFEGEVTTVFSVPGAGKVVIVKHGAYRTVYGNLAETFVGVGSKVSTKQAIGTLLNDDGVSVCHFEVHQVVGVNPITLNPSLWIGR